MSVVIMFAPPEVRLKWLHRLSASVCDGQPANSGTMVFASPISNPPNLSPSTRANALRAPGRIPRSL
jgi:hypothetical protein